MRHIHYALYVDAKGESEMVFLAGFHAREAVFAERAFRKTRGKHKLLVVFNQEFSLTSPPRRLKTSRLLAMTEKVSEMDERIGYEEYDNAEATAIGSFIEDAMVFPDVLASIRKPTSETETVE